MKKFTELRKSKSFMFGGGSGLLTLIAVFVAQVSLNSSCWLLVYQPEVPKSLLK